MAKQSFKTEVELGIAPKTTPKKVLEGKNIVVPENRVYVIFDTGTRRAKYVSTDGNYGCFNNVAGTPQNESARALIGMDYALGSLVDMHNGRFIESNYDDLKIFDNGVLKVGKDNKLSETNLNKAVFLLEYTLEHAVSGKGKEVWLTMAVPPGTVESLQHYARVVRAFNQKRDAEGNGRELPFVKALMVRSQPEMLGKGLGYGWSNSWQWGAGSMSGEASYGIDKEEKYGEIPYITLLGAGDEGDKLLLDLATSKYPHANITLADVRKAKEAHGFVGESKDEVYVTSGAGRRAMTWDITDEMRTVCEKQATKLAANGIVPLLERVPKELQDRVAEHTIVGGGGSAIRGLDKFVLPIVQAVFPATRIEVLDDKVYGECINSLPYVASEHAQRQYTTDL